MLTKERTKIKKREHVKTLLGLLELLLGITIKEFKEVKKSFFVVKEYFILNAFPTLQFTNSSILFDVLRMLLFNEEDLELLPDGLDHLLNGDGSAHEGRPAGGAARHLGIVQYSI